MSGLLQGVAVGGYVPTGSVIHRLDPRVKLAGLLLMIAGILVTDQPLGLIATGLAVVATAALCRAGWAIWWWGLSRFSWMLGIVAAVHLFFHSGGAITTVGGWELPVSIEGVKGSAIFTARLAEVIVLSMALTFSTTPTELTKGCVRMAMPLKRFNISVEEIGFVVMLAMRFVPLFQLEIRGTIEAQEARGVRFGEGGLLSRSHSLVAVLVPALMGTIGRADLLATAIAARGFRPGAQRSEYRPLRFKQMDYVATSALVLFFLCQVAVFR